MVIRCISTCVWWIETHCKSLGKTIEVRKELTDEWEKRGVTDKSDFVILTDEIPQTWSGKTVQVLWWLILVRIIHGIGSTLPRINSHYQFFILFDTFRQITDRPDIAVLDLPRAGAHKRDAGESISFVSRSDKLTVPFPKYCWSTHTSTFEKFDEDIFRRLIEKVRVKSMVEVNFVFKTGVEVREVLG